MGSCASRKAAAAKQQQQEKQPSKKKKRSKSKIYSASMDGIAEEADRVSGIPTRKTPYSRGGGHVPQVTAFGFRRRVPPNNSPLPQPQTGTPVTPSNTTHMIGPSGRSSGRCSPHFPPTPPPIAHNTPPVNTTQIQTKAATSALPKPLTNRFGFQLSQRCAAVLNNINAQILSNSNSNMDPNCNNLLDIETTTAAPASGDARGYPSSNESFTSSDTSVCPTNTSLINANIPKPQAQISKLPMPKLKSESRPASRLPAPKSILKPKSAPNSTGKPIIAKPVVAKPVIRPATSKSAKTEANRMVALQSSPSDSSAVSAISSGCGSLSLDNMTPTREFQRNPRYSLDSFEAQSSSDMREKEKPITRPATAPTAKPEDLDEDEQEEKACIDESLSEKPIEAWVETFPDGRSSSSGSYSEGIEEQQIEFPDNLTDKSADSLFSSCSSASSASSDEPPPKSAQKKKSSGSLSQLSDGSSEQRDFLIDDEIADQPVLTFMTEEGEHYQDDEANYMADEEIESEQTGMYTNDDATCNEENTYNGEEPTYNAEETCTTENTEQRENSGTLIQDLPPSIQGVGEEGGVEAQASPVRVCLRSEHTPNMNRRHRRHSASTGTLSPCESITSDDLMLDFEDISTVDSTPSRLAKSSMRLQDMCSELNESQELIKEWTTMLGSMSSLVECSVRPAPHLRSRTSSGSDVQTTPHGPHGRGSRTSPLRPPRSSSTSGAVLDTEEGCVRLDWNTYQAMVQDLVTLKTNLHRLKRVLQEAEVRNPFDSSLKQNGLYYSLAHSESIEKREENEEGRDDPTLQEENADLRRQVVFLQQQMSDKDRTIHLLQQQMSKYCGSISQVPCTTTDTSGPPQVPDGLSACAPTASTATTNNAATQTERVRPLSTGAALSQSYPSEGGPLVSFRIGQAFRFD